MIDIQYIESYLDRGKPVYDNARISTAIADNNIKNVLYLTTRTYYRK